MNRTNVTCGEAVSAQGGAISLATGLKYGTSVRGMSTFADAAAYFAAKLAFETDPSDVYAALAAGSADFVLIDTRSQEAWDQGHARGAVHIPKGTFAVRIPAEYPEGTAFVVYCWGPACNGATRAALTLSQMGYAVKEMIGGFEYWAREGLPVDRVVVTRDGARATVDGTRSPDPVTNLVGPASAGIACDC